MPSFPPLVTATPDDPAADPGPPPQDPPSQDPTQDPPSQQPVVQAQLQVQGSLDLGSLGTGALQITESGGDRLSWSASSDTPGVSLSRDHGTVRDGRTQVVNVSITADLQALAGPATITVQTRDGQVVVVQLTWTLVPLPPVDAPTPVASATAGVVGAVDGAVSAVSP